MPLSEYQPKVEVVNFPGGSFNVRSISLPDVAVLIDVHEYAITAIVEKVSSRRDDFNSQDEEQIKDAVVDILGDLIRESPILVANLIAICADERNAMDSASKLPITVQIEALTKIAELTFTDTASVKKLAADVMRLIRGMVPTATARPARKK